MPPLQPAAAAPSFNPTVGALPLPPMASAPPVSPAVTPANPEKLTLKQVLEQRKAAAAAAAAGKQAPVASTAPSNSSIPPPQGTTWKSGIIYQKFLILSHSFPLSLYIVLNFNQKVI